MRRCQVPAVQPLSTVSYLALAALAGSPGTFATGPTKFRPNRKEFVLRQSRTIGGRGKTVAVFANSANDQCSQSAAEEDQQTHGPAMFPNRSREGHGHHARNEQGRVPAVAPQFYAKTEPTR